MQRVKVKARSRTARTAELSSEEFRKWGTGSVAYIKKMTTEEATEQFPTVSGLPEGIDLFALHAADGTPLCLTDSRQAAIGHAMGDSLDVARVH